MKETIDIALASDNGFFCGLLTTATSIAQFAAPDVELRYHILDGGISGSNWRMLRGMVMLCHPLSIIEKLPVVQEMFNEFPSWRGNKMAYARLLLPYVLETLDYVIYCDVDYLWLKDIAQLWKERDARKVIVSTVDGNASTIQKEQHWFAANGLRFDAANYFCSGLCLLNLKKMRAEDLSRKCMEFIRLHQDVQFPDQTALNALACDDIKLVDKRWQQFTVFLAQEDLDGGVAIHYAGDNPWKIVNRLQMLSDATLLWHKFNANIRNETLWRSLRRHFSPLQIFWHRGLVYFYRSRIGGFVSKLLCITGHQGVDYWWRIRSRRLRFTMKGS